MVNKLPLCMACNTLGLDFGSAAGLSKRPGMCGTIYGDMHLKDLLGSIIRIGYCVLVPDFYLVLHVFRCRKSTIKD